VLRAWVDAGWLRALDEAFADFVAAPAAGQALFGPSDNFDPLVRLAAAWVSHQAGRGQTGLDLAATLADPTAALDLPPQDGPTRTPAPTPAHQEAAGPVLPLPGDLLAGVTLTTWVAALRAHTAVGEGAGSTPLVLAQERLYLRRHWQCEQSIEQALGQRLQQPLAVDDAALCQALDALFAPSAPPDADEPDWQKIACALAARQAFAIVTGGPGTGKTTTVVKLLAVLQHLALQAGATAPGPLRIRLAAPTGKAAARLAESIAKARDALALDGLPGGSAVRAALPTEVSTLHRLLGVKPGSRHFRHHAQQPLPLDVLVIDEASMVDLEMMAAVLAALPPQARLVLLGDKDQLASVEAGAVLGTLCQRADGGHYTPATRDWVQQVTGQDLGAAMTDPEGRAMDQAIVKLRKSHRFGEGSGIGRLAQAVNAGQDVAARQLLSHGLPDLDLATDLSHLPPLCRPLWQTLQQQRPPSDATPGAYDAWAHQVLKAAARFQVLCAVRGGPQGVEAVNRRIAQALAAEGLIPHAEGWFLGRPVMVTRNDYALGLMNGDAGVTLEGPAGPATPPPLRVAFPDGRGGIRWVPVSRLQAVETVFAMTVHKSQGSEFDHVALVLPTHASPVLTRELVYTAITRARQRFTLALPGQDLGVLAQAIGRQVRLAGTPAA
jgi:exodeoxyribonuclease V alpha subunit